MRIEVEVETAMVGVEGPPAEKGPVEVLESTAVLMGVVAYFAVHFALLTFESGRFEVVGSVGNQQEQVEVLALRYSLMGVVAYFAVHIAQLTFESE